MKSSENFERKIRILFFYRSHEHLCAMHNLISSVSPPACSGSAGFDERRDDLEFVNANDSERTSESCDEDNGKDSSSFPIHWSPHIWMESPLFISCVVWQKKEEEWEEDATTRRRNDVELIIRLFAGKDINDVSFNHVQHNWYNYVYVCDANPF